MLKLVLGGLVAVGAILTGVLLARGDHDQAAAIVLSVTTLVVVSGVLFMTGPRRKIALREIEYTVEGETRIVRVGEVLPKAAEKRKTKNRDYKEQRGLWFQGLFIGRDGRWSTSKVQALLWTFAIAFGLLALAWAMWLGDDTGWDELIDDGLEGKEEYLILLGGPFAAAILAKISTSEKVESGTVQKTDSDPSTDPVSGIGEVISNDQGGVDLVDFQYFLFNLVALTYFLGEFVVDLEQGFPELPALLVGLTSVSAATYVGKKAAEKEVPVLTSVVPVKQRPDGEIEIAGRYLVLETETPADSPEAKPTVLINEDEVEEVKVLSSRAGKDRLKATVPANARVGSTDLRVVTAAGNATDEPLDFEVVSGVRIRSVTPSTVLKKDPDGLVILGSGFGAGETATQPTRRGRRGQGERATTGNSVELDGRPLQLEEWGEGRIRAKLASGVDYSEGPEVPLVVQNAEGLRSPEHKLKVEPPDRNEAT